MTSDAVDGKYNCPNTLGRILFALTSLKQLKVGGLEAVLNRYSCAPAAVEDLEAAQNDRAPWGHPDRLHLQIVLVCLRPKIWSSSSAMRNEWREIPYGPLASECNVGAFSDVNPRRWSRGYKLVTYHERRYCG